MTHWSAVTPPGPPLAPLEGHAEADVAIIGAGFTGLSTALHLLARGKSIAVLEAVEPGYGASGRNNGQVIPTLSRMDPDDLVAKHGAAGDRFADLVRDSASILFDFVREHGLKAEAEQSGWVQPAHTPGRIRISEKRFAQWAKRGAPVRMLSTSEMASLLGTDFWHGGFMNPTGGHINPLALAREMARRVIELGGTIHAPSVAESFRREGDFWLVSTAKGVLRARALMLASNAYSGEFSRGLEPEMAREVVPILSWQMATQPIADDLRARILPGRQAVSDTHGDLHFMRYDARNQIVTGGALIIAANGHDRLRTRIADRLRRIFPEIGAVRFEHVWNGYVGMTNDFCPRLHQLGPDAWGWTGCNGRGVALSVALGREFAAAICGTRVDDLALPLTPVKPLAFHGIVRVVAPLLLLEYRRRDAREIA